MRQLERARSIHFMNTIVRISGHCDKLLRWNLSRLRTSDTRLDCCTRYKYSGDRGSGGTDTLTRRTRSGRSMLLVKNRGARINSSTGHRQVGPSRVLCWRTLGDALLGFNSALKNHSCIAGAAVVEPNLRGARNPCSGIAIYPHVKAPPNDNRDRVVGDALQRSSSYGQSALLAQPQLRRGIGGAQ
jgi:hypothetical protein